MKTALPFARLRPWPSPFLIIIASLMMGVALTGAGESPADHQPAASSGRFILGFEGATVTIAANEAPAHEVLGALARHLNLRLKVAQEIGRQISLYLPKVSPESAFETILRRIDPTARVRILYRRDRYSGARVMAGVLSMAGRRPSSSAKKTTGVEDFWSNPIWHSVGPPLPASSLVVPAARKLAAPNPRGADRNANRLDDSFDAVLAEVTERATQGQLQEASAALATRVPIQLVFSEPITQEDFDHFLAFGGEVQYVYKHTSYGWNGSLPLGKVAQLPAAMGDKLLVGLAPRALKPALIESTVIGHARNVWTMIDVESTGRQAGVTGEDENSPVTIAILDAGVTESHPDLALPGAIGMGPFQYDFVGCLINCDPTGPTAGALPTPDYSGHGTHMASIAVGLGTSADEKLTTDGKLYYTIDGNMVGIDGSFLYSGLHFTEDLPTTWESTVMNMMTYISGRTPRFVQLARDNGFLPSGFPSLNEELPVETQIGVGGSTVINQFTPVADKNYTASLEGDNFIGTVSIINNATYARPTGPLFQDPAYGALSGVAPGAQYFVLKVWADPADEVWGYTPFTTSIFAVQEALDFAIDNRHNFAAPVSDSFNLKVLLLSMGVDAENVDFADIFTSVARDALSASASEAVNNGIIVVSPAGNDAGTPVAHPGRGGKIITVGAVNDNLQVTDYSSPGPSGETLPANIKPDLVAPGGSDYYTRMLATDSNDADLFGLALDAQLEDYANASGTSRAAAFVAGCAALVADAIMEDRGLNSDDPLVPEARWRFGGDTVRTYLADTDPMMVKTLLCITATETGQTRENPRQTNPPSYNPPLDRAGDPAASFPKALPKDNIEGFGMVNVETAVEARRGWFILGTGDTATFSGTTDGTPQARRAWARRFASTAPFTFTTVPDPDGGPDEILWWEWIFSTANEDPDQAWQFRTTSGIAAGLPVTISLDVPDNGDFDLYLFNSEGEYDFAPVVNDGFGNPIMWNASTNIGQGVNESLTVTTSTDSYPYVVVKRVSGGGTFTVSVAAPTLTVVIEKDWFDENDVIPADEMSAAVITRHDSDTTGPLVVSMFTTQSMYVVDPTDPDMERPLSPSEVVIPAGETSVSVSLRAIDDIYSDADVNPVRNATMMVAAFSFISGMDNVQIWNDELEQPTLPVAVHEDEIFEGDTPSPATVTRRNAVNAPNQIDEDLDVQLESENSAQAVAQSTLAGGGQNVTIPAGEISAPFYIVGVEDGDSSPADSRVTVTISAFAAGYLLGADHIDIVDTPSLELTILDTALDEGQATTATVRRTDIGTTDLTVAISNDDTSEITVPSTVDILAGDSTATFAVSSIADGVEDGDQTVTLGVTATNFSSDSETLTVRDTTVVNRVLSIDIATRTISEYDDPATGAAENETLATVTRQEPDTTSSLVVSLTITNRTNPANPLRMTTDPPGQVIFAAGETSATIRVLGIDEAKLNGTEEMRLTVSAQSFSSDTVDVDVTDHESLSISVDSPTIRERDGAGAAIATIRRNNDDDFPGPPTPGALTVTVASSAPDKAAMASTVVIPAGQQEKKVVVSAVDNGVRDGDQLVTFTISATGYIGDTADITVQESNNDVLIYKVTIERIRDGDGVSRTRQMTRGYAVFEIVNNALVFTHLITIFNQGGVKMFQIAEDGFLTDVQLAVAGPAGSEYDVFSYFGVAGGVEQAWAMSGKRLALAIGGGTTFTAARSLSGRIVELDRTTPTDSDVAAGRISYRLDLDRTGAANRDGMTSSSVVAQIRQELLGVRAELP